MYYFLAGILDLFTICISQSLRCRRATDARHQPLSKIEVRQQDIVHANFHIYSTRRNQAIYIIHTFLIGCMTLFQIFIVDLLAKHAFVRDVWLPKYDVIIWGVDKIQEKPATSLSCFVHIGNRDTVIRTENEKLWQDHGVVHLLKDNGNGHVLVRRIFVLSGRNSLFHVTRHKLISKAKFG